MMRSKIRWTPVGLMALVALGVVAVFAVAPATADEAGSVVSTVSDPVGDANFNAPGFQDVVFAQITETADGDFELLMEMAGPVPVDPPMPPPGNSEIWWVWNFDLDPTTAPVGYPILKANSPFEVIAYVSWDGTAFAGTAVDRRPLLNGGKAIITPVTFSIDGAILRAELAYAQIGAVPASFSWRGGTLSWSGPVGSSEANHLVDASGFAQFP